MFMTKKPEGYWMLVGTYNQESYREESRAAIKFAAMVAVHNKDFNRNEKEIMAAIKSGKKNIQWNPDKDMFE